MTNENIENIVKIDSKSFADMCKQIIELEEENKSLQMDNDFLQKQNTALKLRCSKYALENKELNNEIAARSLLGVPMTLDEVAIDKAENAYVPYTGDDF